MADPAAAEGDDQARKAAFRKAFEIIRRRVGLLVALPLEKLDRDAMREDLEAIGKVE
jgi:arsenate reductase